jgi:uncharacterized protein (DUF1810 family)
MVMLLGRPRLWSLFVNSPHPTPYTMLELDEASSMLSQAPTGQAISDCGGGAATCPIIERSLRLALARRF